MPQISDELESLRRENARLRRLLELTDAQAAPARGTQTAWFDKAPGSVDARSSSQAKVDFYAALFAARRDVTPSGGRTPVTVSPAGRQRSKVAGARAPGRPTTATSR